MRQDCLQFLTWINCQNTKIQDLLSQNVKQWKFWFRFIVTVVQVQWNLKGSVVTTNMADHCSILIFDQTFNCQMQLTVMHIHFNSTLCETQFSDKDVTAAYNNPATYIYVTCNTNFQYIYSQSKLYIPLPMTTRPKYLMFFHALAVSHTC